MSRQGRLERAERIRQKHIDQARELLDCVMPQFITGVVQVGIGSWDEGPVLRETFPGRRFLGIEPLSRYQLADYPGEIVRGVAFRRPVAQVDIADRYGKTSLWAWHPRKDCEIESVPAYRIDDLMPGRFDESDSLLLWMDCEGGEADAILGAHKTLQSEMVDTIIVEHRDEPEAMGWCSSREIFDLMDLYGFRLVKSFERRRGMFDSVFEIIL